VFRIISVFLILPHSSLLSHTKIRSISKLRILSIPPRFSPTFHILPHAYIHAMHYQHYHYQIHRHNCPYLPAKVHHNRQTNRSHHNAHSIPTAFHINLSYLPYSNIYSNNGISHIYFAKSFVG